MAYEQNLKSITLPAGGDLSGSQYRFMTVNSSGQAVAVSVEGAKAQGVLQNKPAAVGQAAAVAFEGTSKVLAVGTIAAGDSVMSDNAGKAKTFTSNSGANTALGTALASAVAGDIFPVLLALGE